MKLCLDLCSGLGGFSQAFLDAGWEVIRIDNDPRFKDVPSTVIGSVLDMVWIKSIISERPTVIVASPPCQCFSIANPHWPRKGIREALDIVGACLELIVELKPKYWVMENPKGRLRWFIGAKPVTVNIGGLGYRTAKPTDLWGNIPFGLLPDHPRHNIGSYRKNGRSRNFDEVRDLAKRAEMPLGLSKAVLEAVER